MYIMYVLYTTIQITNPPASRPNRIATPWWPRRWPPRWGSPAMKPKVGFKRKACLEIPAMWWYWIVLDPILKQFWIWIVTVTPIGLYLVDVRLVVHLIHQFNPNQAPLKPIGGNISKCRKKMKKVGSSWCPRMCMLGTAHGTIITYPIDGFDFGFWLWLTIWLAFPRVGLEP